MEAEASAIAFKISSDLRMLRFVSYLLVAAWGFNLVLRLLITVPQLFGGSPIPFADIAVIIAFSTFIFVGVSMLTPQYRRAFMRGRDKWHRKSKAERFRTVCLVVLGGLALGVLPLFALVLVEMARSRAQDIGTSSLATTAITPVYMLIVAVFWLASVLWTSLNSP